MEPNTSNNDVVTMLDVLNDENELADQAAAVLSGSDEKNCNGFQKRQALYSCLTCAPDSAKTDFSKSIGVCLACSLHCHEKHELVELYTKRDFRCDCGIKQEGGAKCQLDPTKKRSTSEVNKFYNQNFVGLYCSCHRPYPDLDNTNNDEMIQCIVCEDWYHSGHLNRRIPSSESYDEMICGDCMTKTDFLSDYSGYSIRSVDPETSVDTSSLNVTSLVDSVVAKEDDTVPDAKKPKLSDDACVRPKIGNDVAVTRGATTFWKDGWRRHLCKCAACLKVYGEAKVEFLIDLEDTTQNYEEKGKQIDRPSSYMASLEALGSLTHVNQINAISGYNQMKDKLFEFLQTFVVNNQIVTEEDIQRFFRNMKDSNEQAPVSQPHFCR